MLLPPSGRGQVQGQAQQLEPEPVLVPQPLGLQGQQPQALQRSHHRIQAPQWLVSSFHHASIARMRLSKPNR